MASPVRPGRRPSSILIWQGGALGDTLLAYPALAALRTWAPAARITLIAHPSYAGFALASGLVDAIEDIDGVRAASLFGEGTPALAPPELAVVWSSAYEHLAHRLKVMGTLAIIAAPPRPADRRHQARYLLDCLLPLGLPRPLHPAPVLPLPVPSEPLAAPGQGLPIILHPGAGARWKQWPLAGWLALADLLGDADHPVRWSFGPDDQDLRTALLRQRPDLEPTLWPALPLPQFAVLLARARLLVSPDTGVAHLAALLRVPQVTLFGPTDPRRWRPLSRLALLARAPDRCGGQWEHGLRRCVGETGDHCSCLAALDPSLVLALCTRALEAPPTAPDSGLAP